MCGPGQSATDPRAPSSETAPAVPLHPLAPRRSVRRMFPSSSEPMRVVHVCGGTRAGSTGVVLRLAAHHDRARISPAICFFGITPVDEAVLGEVVWQRLPWREV